MLDDILTSDWTDLYNKFTDLAGNHRFMALFYVLVAAHVVLFSTYLWCKCLTWVYRVSERIVHCYWRLVRFCIRPLGSGLLAIALYQYTIKVPDQGTGG